ncbi:MAG: hypothetical protein PWP65_1175 [Clostridia bacterium]|nr:hypothetical protein [Clostridia bacterium]
MALVEFEVKDRIAYITLNRPEKMNAVNQEMLQSLIDYFTEVKDNPDIWVAIITGTGKAFSSGHDLSHASFGKKGPRAYDLYTLLPRIYKPIIAAINGICLAQGCGLALSTDIQIASENAKFGWPQVKRGISSVSGPTILARRVPLNIAFDYLFTGEFIDAQEAYRWGLVNKVVKHEELMPAAEEKARQILENAPLAVRAMKEATLLTRYMRDYEAQLVATRIIDELSKTEDAQEGIRAFQEKRKPVWKGR